MNTLDTFWKRNLFIKVSLTGKEPKDRGKELSLRLTDGSKNKTAEEICIETFESRQ